MILAMFNDEAGLSHALGCLRDARIGPLQTYTPAALQEDTTVSPIPAIALVAGLAGAAASFGLQCWSAIDSYRFDVGGRPAFSWASFVPTAFENGVLLALVAGFVAFFAVNGLPRHYDPVDESDAMRRALRDRWFVRVDSGDEATLSRASDMLRELGAISVEALPQ